MLGRVSGPVMCAEGATMSDSASRDEKLLARAVEGDQAAATELLSAYRERLRKMVTSRLDTRLAARVDPSDVVQETLLAVVGQLPGYAREQPMPFYPWLRRLALQRMIDLERRHLRAERRSVLREEARPPRNDSTIHELARHLLAHVPGPHSEAVAAEREASLRRAVDALEETQREVLLLHYVEDLSLAEAAEILQITADAARMRHFRALKQLRELLDTEPQA
jgi:RNA polymerase sigma-70 factor (ECF subfamily)